MSKLRIDEVQNVTVEPVDQDEVQVRRRKDFHKTSEFQRSGPETFAGIGRPDLSALKVGSAQAPTRVDVKPILYVLPDGQELEIPQLSQDDRAKVEAILARLAPAKRVQLIESADELGEAVWEEVENNPAGIKVGSFSAGLQNAANASYEVTMATTGENSRNKVTEDLLVMGMSGVENNLFGFFTKLQEKQALGNDMRTEIAELEGMLQDWPAGKDKQIFSYREVIMNPDGTTKVIEHKNEALTKDQAAALVTKLKGQQDALSTITTQDSTKLQLMTEKYQQAMNTLSNIIKAQDDTRKAIIANAKA
jgi:hypothetical protein